MAVAAAALAATDRTAELLAACGRDDAAPPRRRGGGGGGAAAAAEGGSEPGRERAFGTQLCAAAARVAALAAFVGRVGRDYAAEGRLGEAERDGIELEVARFVKACREQVELVRASAEAGAAAVGLPRSRASDATAHALGAALALSEALLRATESFDAARARRCAVALQRSKGADAGAAARFFADPGNAERVAARVAAQVADEDALHHDHERPPPQEQQQQQQQQRAEAVSAVHARLAETLTASRMAERSALELQAMSQVLSSHVARQAEQIEALYESAVAASANLAAGNVELSKAKERTGQATRYSVWAMVIAGLLLLLMDWMLP